MALLADRADPAGLRSPELARAVGGEPAGVGRLLEALAREGLVVCFLPAHESPPGSVVVVRPRLPWRVWIGSQPRL